jgi:hypothetical protein
MLRTLLTGKIARLVVGAAAVVMLSGAPAYAGWRSYVQQVWVGDNTAIQVCNPQPWNNCQPQTVTNQAPAQRTSDDGNSK